MRPSPPTSNPQSQKLNKTRKPSANSSVIVVVVAVGKLVVVTLTAHTSFNLATAQVVNIDKNSQKHAWSSFGASGVSIILHNRAKEIYGFLRHGQFDNLAQTKTNRNK